MIPFPLVLGCAMSKPKMGHAERARIAAVRNSGKSKRATRKRDAREDGEKRRAIARAPAPDVTAEAAMEFVKLLAAGLPYSHIFRYLAPEYWALIDDESREKVISAWLASPLLAMAATKLNGGAWQELDKDTRIGIALDKHASQLAYLLYTTNPNDIIDKLTLDKVRDAREALFEMQRLAQGGEQGAFAHMIADLLAGKVEGQSEGPNLEPPREGAEESGDAVVGTPVELGASVPIEALDLSALRKRQLN